MNYVSSYIRKGSMNLKAQLYHYSLKWMIRTLFAVSVAFTFSGIGYYYLSPLLEPEVMAYNAEESKMLDRLDIKVAELKQDVIDKLASCESGGAKEPDALIVFDSNKVASIGWLQFQVATVQHYIAKFEEREITKLEAIEIAHSKKRAETLAETIIFDEIGGVWNWRNCAEKLDLAPRIELIRELETN